jgi:hypothetical protein
VNFFIALGLAIALCWYGHFGWAFAVIVYSIAMCAIPLRLAIKYPGWVDQQRMKEGLPTSFIKDERRSYIRFKVAQVAGLAAFALYAGWRANFL